MKNRLLLVVFSVVCLVALLMPGCAKEAPAPAPAPAAEEPTWVIAGSICALSGPGAAIHAPSDAAWRDYWKYVNEEKGGVQGKKGTVKVKTISCDSEYKADKAKQCFSKLKDEGMIVHTHYASAHSDQLLIDYEAAKIPLIAGSAGVASAWSDWCYNTVHSGANNMGRSFMNWRKAEWDKAGKTGTLKVGFLGVDEPYTPLVLYKLDEYAAEVSDSKTKVEAYVEIFPPAATDCAAQVLRLKDAEVDGIYVSITHAHGPMVAKSVRRAGIDPFEMPVAYACCAAMEDCITLGGADIMEGMIGAYWTVPIGHAPDIPDPEAMKIAKANWEKWHSGEGPITAIYTMSVVTPAVFEEALRLALEEITPEELTGETVKIHGLDRIRDFDELGMCYPFSYTPGDHLGTKHVSYWQVQNGQLVNVSGWVQAATTKIQIKK